MSAHTKPRAGSSALVPGVALFEEIGSDGYPRWRVRAVAQEEGTQRRSDHSPLRYGLAEAIRRACAWRAERAAGSPPVDELERAAWRRLSPQLLSRMREAGVDVRRRGLR